MKNKITCSLLFMFCLALSLCRCSSNTPVAGGSSDHGNAVVSLSVVNQDGTPSAGSGVLLRPADYLADTSLAQAKRRSSVYQTTTDDSGRFVMDSVDQGKYVIEINDGKSTAVAVNCSIDSGEYDLGKVTMAPYAVVAGTVDSKPVGAGATYVQVYGLERVALTDTLGNFTFNDLPAGSYDIRIVSPSMEPAIIAAIEAKAGDTVTIPFAGHPHKRNLYLDTKSSGAGVTQDITDFPVLIRLDSTMFDFAKAGSGGKDIRFTKGDGTVLSHEIESWAPYANIWVLVDTVFGDDTTQIIMHWGNLNAAGASDGADVFDTANGFCGVWHLGAELTDATSRANHASDYGSTDVAGIIGQGRGFDGNSGRIDAGNPVDSALDIKTGSFSYTAWVRAEANAPDYEFAVYKGGSSAGTSGYSMRLGTGDWKAAVSDGVTGAYASFGAETELAGQWVLLSVSVNRGTAKIETYVNGAFRGEVDISALGAIISPHRLTFGAYENGEYPFRGAIDEVRIESRSRDASYMKLRFENEKQGSSFIQYHF